MWKSMLWVTGTLVLATAAPVAAQTAPPRKVFTNRQTFSLPVKIEERDKTELRELKFFVKTIQAGRAGEWQCVESAPPTKGRFMFQAQQDGEYWFAFATVDRMGRIMPPDLDREPPGLVVVVDTKTPEIDVHKLTAASGETFLQCHVNDANPDYAKIRLEAVMPDRSVRMLEPVEETPGFFRVNDPAIFKCVVRATTFDKAGNRTIRELDMNPSSPPPIALTSAQAAAAPTVVPAVAPSRPVERLEQAAFPPAQAPTVLPPAGRQLLNGQRCALDYALDSPNVTRVEVYGTRDGGRSWLRLGDDPDRRSPIEFDLPEDGVYGVSLVLSTSNRPGGTPTAGDAPDCWIEVDATRPTVTAADVRPGVGDDWGHLLVNWSSQDKNLAPDPVEILISAHQEGPWVTLARGQKPEGSAKLALPRELTGRVFVRVESRDLAGNCGRWDTREALSLDVGKPKARVLGVNATPKK